MPNESSGSGLQLRSTVKAEGVVELSLIPVRTPEPGPEEVVVRVEASPINPSDLGLLLAGADPAAVQRSGTAENPIVTAKLSPEALRALQARIGQPLPVGNEGAGVVVAAGSSPAAQALLGKTVSMMGGEMYCQYRCLHLAQCQALPEGTSAEQGASWFVNPMTALGMLETMRREGHTALVHTAAASNLGQMLVKLCQKDGVGLINVVRKAEQAALLRSLGAVHVVDSSTPTFMKDLVEAVSATSATVAFDAVGGGNLVSQILMAMEVVASKGAAYSRYGSATHKQAYVYGTLDPSPTVLNRTFGFAWGVGGWLLPTFLQKAGYETVQRLRARVASELTTTFASSYSRRVSLREALQPEVIAAYGRQATGEKYLITPQAN